MRDEYVTCAAEGLTVRETAERLGVTKPAVYSAAARLGLTFTPPPTPCPFSAESMSRKPKTLSSAHRAAIAYGVRRVYANGGARKGLENYLTEQELRDYRLLRRNGGYSKAMALEAIGHADLIGSGAR